MNKLARLPAIQRARRASARQLKRLRRPQARYFAFLSYSHKDEDLAGWLHSQLEQFRVPRALAGQLSEHGVIPKRLTPIFRDQHELAAADDLGEEIEEALARSRFLIVLCSPDAAKSRWTNAEIETFKRTRPDGCVLAAIASGEPFASEMPGREEEECFPPALKQKYDRRGHPTAKRAEPLAADLREQGEAQRLGLMKLIAGMLGVGLDDLLQRETTRRQRRLAYVAAASLAGMAITSTLAITAIQARNEAREQRREAEGLVGFMLGDLKDKLEPIGRLDALDGVGSRVLAYYQKEGTTDLSDAALLQRSRALSLMGQVANLRGNMGSAIRFYREAMAGTAEAIRRNPSDPQRVYDHAQNVFWVASINSSLGNLPAAEAGMREYKRLAQQMVALDPNNMKWRMEDQDADVNLGFVLQTQRRFGEAANMFGQAVQMIQALATADPRNSDYKKMVAETMAWLADAQMANGNLEAATRVREEQVRLLSTLAQQPNADVAYRDLLVPAEEALGSVYAMRGQRQLAFQHYSASADTAKQLIATEPNNTLWLNWAMSTQLSFADALLRAGQASQAAEHGEAGCAIDQGLLARNGQFPSWRGGARECWLIRAQVALASNRKDEALRDAQQAVAVAETVKTADRFSDKYGLSKAYLMLGEAQRSMGNSAAAAEAWRRALDEFPKGVAEKPRELEQHARIMELLGDTAGARQMVARLNAMGYRRTL
jgi:tetratricopeptide (TPR) repeat protein